MLHAFFYKNTRLKFGQNLRTNSEQSEPHISEINKKVLILNPFFKPVSRKLKRAKPKPKFTGSYKKACSEIQERQLRKHFPAKNFSRKKQKQHV